MKPWDSSRPSVSSTTASSLTKQSMTVEYPDPVVASFLSRVRLLAAEPDEPSWAERRRRVVQADGWKRRVIGLAALALHAASMGFIVAYNTWLVGSREARIAYRGLFRDLRRAGWGRERLAPIAHALYAVRNRRGGPKLVRLYEMTMQSRIPRQSLGWIDDGTR